jgi:phosphate transport system substrate-binding protein
METEQTFEQPNEIESKMKDDEERKRKRRRNLTIGAAVAGIVIMVVVGGLLLRPRVASHKTYPTAMPAPAEFVLTISGSGTTTSILNAVKLVFEADVPGYSLNVLLGTGTGGGVEGVAQGKLDVAAMARPPKDAEAAQGVEWVEFGQSGVAVYTHPDVGVAELTAEQVAAIFSGEVANWSEVGGSDQIIILYVRDEGDSSTKALRQAVFGDMQFPETAQVLTSQADMQTAVSGTSGSVGFGSWPSALAAGVNVRAVALGGVSPGDLSYPIVGSIGIGYLAERQADVQPLIDWLLSDPGQAALREFGVISIRQ